MKNFSILFTKKADLLAAFFVRYMSGRLKNYDVDK